MATKNLTAKLQEAVELKRAEKKEPKSFTIGKVFRHRDENCVLQYHYGNFAILVNESAGMVIPISKAKNKLSEYVLSRNMNDSAIQDAAKSTPMEKDEFFATLYLLIIEPKLGKELLGYELRKDKWYVLHVRLKSGKTDAVGVRWRTGVWRQHALVFDAFSWWGVGVVFLFPACPPNPAVSGRRRAAAQ